MTPKQKAEKLVNEFYRIIPLDKMTLDFNLAKKCALIAVDEIMSALTYLPYGLDYLNKICYWEEVKQEIEAL